MSEQTQVKTYPALLSKHQEIHVLTTLTNAMCNDLSHQSLRKYQKHDYHQPKFSLMMKKHWK